MNAAMFAAIVLTIVAARPAAARDYYFSTQGSDASGDGSHASPYQTIAHLNTLDLEPGDRVLFHSGDTFEGPIRLEANDSATDSDGVLRRKPIQFQSFGGRPRPIIASARDYGLYATNVGGIRIRRLEFAGSSNIDEITDPANTTAGILFENRNCLIQQHRIVIDDVAVHGFGEAGIKFTAVNPATAAGGFADVRLLRSAIHSNGRSGVMSNVLSASGKVTDGSLYDFQSRAHANFLVRRNVVHQTFGKRESGGVSGNGIVLAQVAKARIQFNVAHHNGGIAGGGAVAIWTWESDQVRIEFNEAYANDSFDGRDGGGFDLDGGTRQSVLQYNYSHGNHGAAYGLFEFGYASPMQNNVIRYNVSEADGSGVAAWGSGPRFGGSDVAAASLFYNNTVVQPLGPAAHFFGSLEKVGVYNNVFLSSGGHDLVQRTDFDGAGSAYTIDVAMLANAYWSGADAFRIVWDDQTYMTLADWSAATQQETIGAVLVGLEADPGLTGPLSGGSELNQPIRFSTLTAYRLLPTSPLIDAGATVHTLPLPRSLGLTDIGTRDFDGGMLPRGADFDIGANER